MGEHILIVSSSGYFANNMKDKIKHYDPLARVAVLTEPKNIGALLTMLGRVLFCLSPTAGTGQLRFTSQRYLRKESV